MFIFALLAYRNFFGAAVILQLALFFKWYALPMSFYFYGLRDTTASYAIIFLNIIPLVTLILALMARQESLLQFGTAVGWLKIGGVLVSLGGAMIMSLYKGKVLHLWPSIVHHHNMEKHVEVTTHQLRGTIFLLGNTFTSACWYLIQSKVLKVYPYKYWSSMATCSVGGLQTLVLGIILRRDRNAWKLGWNIQHATVAYSGALTTAARYSLDSWVVAKRGPAYHPVFSPLSAIFTIVLGSIFIGEYITVGSVLGTVIVIIGLYIFLWAKSKE